MERLRECFIGWLGFFSFFPYSVTIERRSKARHVLLWQVKKVTAS